MSYPDEYYADPWDVRIVEASRADEDAYYAALAVPSDPKEEHHD